jgi:hypothetical protein
VGRRGSRRARSWKAAQEGSFVKRQSEREVGIDIVPVKGAAEYLRKTSANATRGSAPQLVWT